MNLFRLKATVMLVVTGVWVIYVASAVLRDRDVGLQWVGLPGAVFFALFGQIRRRGNGSDSSESAP